MKPSILYKIKPSNPYAHIFTVTLTITNPQEEQTVRLPCWIPGSYMIRDFVRCVVQIKGCDDQGELSYIKSGKGGWTFKPRSGSLSVEYEIFAWDLSVRMAHLDQTHGYFNGTSVFLYAEGFEEQPVEVTILPPDGSEYENWKIATTLTRADDIKDIYSFGVFQAEDYDELIDHPVEMGTFDIIEWESCGVPHAMVFTGVHNADLEKIKKDLIPICDYFIQFFGAPAPMNRYLFQTMVVGSGYGGLEHRASTSLLCSRSSLPQIGAQNPPSGYRNFLGLCAHEYFHTWNIKRIKPAVFMPYDLQREVHTTLLWVFEGFTSYYDDFGLLRNGLTTIADYFEVLGVNASRIYKNSGLFKQSLSDSSYDAWVKLYRQDENAPNSQISYYAKGAVVALCLDLKLRLESSISLDDVMREMWYRYGKPNIGVPEEGIENLIMELSGLDLTEFFDYNIRGTGEPPLEELLLEFGIQMERRAELRNGENSGKLHPVEKRDHEGCLGVKYSKAPGRIGAKLHWVFDGGAAQKSGLSANDVVVAVDYLAVDHSSIFERIAKKGAGSTVVVHAFRRDELMTFEVELQAPNKNLVQFRWMDNVSEEIEIRRRNWLQAPSEKLLST